MCYIIMYEIMIGRAVSGLKRILVNRKWKCELCEMQGNVVCYQTSYQKYKNPCRDK